MKVSSIQEVMEQFRQDIVANLQAAGFKPPQEAITPGNHFEAVIAWARLQHRSVAKAPRLVKKSKELQQRSLEPWIENALSQIGEEIERGDDLTHRLSRQVYKAGFNDFLFNTFRIHHVHLGVPGAAVDKTRKHVMSGGAHELLFVMIDPRASYFLDVISHDVFDSPALSKALVEIALRNWPELLAPYIAPGVSDVDLSFEDAFRMRKAGFMTLFELDGVVFVLGGNVMDGKVVDGERAPCTSAEVVDVANLTLNRIARLVEFIHRDVDALSALAESRTGSKPTEFKLVVVRAGNVAIVREQNTAIEFFNDGHSCGALRP